MLPTESPSCWNAIFFILIKTYVHNWFHERGKFFQGWWINDNRGRLSWLSTKMTLSSTSISLKCFHWYLILIQYRIYFVNTYSWTKMLKWNSLLGFDRWNINRCEMMRRNEKYLKQIKRLSFALHHLPWTTPGFMTGGVWMNNYSCANILFYSKYIQMCSSV